MKFYVYVDSTQEETPRPFYVGKGNSKRLDKLERNKFHDSISKKYGLSRTVVFETEHEQEALDKEIELISELKTYFFDNDESWGANFTKGGEGISGYVFTEEQKMILSEACSGDKNGMFGKHHSEETIAKIKENSSGWHHTDEAKRILAESAKKIHTGRKRSEETRKRMSESSLGKVPWNKGKKFGPREKKRTFSEQARLNISEACKGRIPWNKGIKIKNQEDESSQDADQLF
jgi:hypothetical protein